MQTNTQGNVVVEKIKVGDTHYEFDLGVGLKVRVLTMPVKSRDQWLWKSEHISTGKIIDYVVTEGQSHFAPKLFDYIAFKFHPLT